MNNIPQRTQKLGEVAKSIRELESKELEAKTGLAWIAVQLGQQYIAAKAEWTGAKGEEKLWREWIQNHSTNSDRTVRVYMQVAEIWEASDERQRSAILARGSIAGLLESVKQPVTETPKSSPAWLSLCDSFQKWRDKFTVHAAEFPPEGLDKLRGEFEVFAKQLWPEKFA